GLLEDAVLVAETVAHGGKLHRRHRIEKACGQAAEPAISQAGVRLLLNDGEPIEPLILDRASGEVIEEEICDVVRERASDEELHGKIVDPLRIVPLVGS